MPNNPVPRQAPVSPVPNPNPVPPPDQKQVPPPDEKKAPPPDDGKNDVGPDQKQVPPPDQKQVPPPDDGKNDVGPDQKQAAPPVEKQAPPPVEKQGPPPPPEPLPADPNCIPGITCYGGTGSSSSQLSRPAAPPDTGDVAGPQARAGTLSAVTERTLVLIKPDGVERRLIGEVVGRIERKGLTIAALEMRDVGDELARKHYAEHDGKPFFDSLLEFITSGPVVAAIVEGPRAIAAFRQLAGGTDPVEKAATGSIRGDLALVTQENIVHGSDSPESAAREIELWFPGR